MGEVLIKNVEMPKHCAMCGFHGAMSDPMISQYFCKATGERILNPYKGRLDNCPLIPVPPHGRLIDADAFIKEECNSCDGACESIPCDCLNCAADCRCDFMKDIADAPTIIPAEGGKDG